MEPTAETQPSIEHPWARRLCLLLALGLGLRWRSDQSRDSVDDFIRLHWPQLGPNLELLLPGAVTLAVHAYRRMCRKRTSRWVSMMPTLDKRTQWLVERMEQWAGQSEPEQDQRLAEELGRLEAGFAEGQIARLLGDIDIAFREAAQLPDWGEQAGQRLAQLEAECEHQLRRWITDLVGGNSLLLEPIPFQVLKEAIPAAAGQMMQQNNALRSYDPRHGDQWFGQAEQVLGRLAFRLEQLEATAPEEKDVRNKQLEELAWRVDWASGLLTVLHALPELEGEAAKFETLARRRRDLHDRIRVLRQMLATSTRRVPVTERRQAVQLPAEEALPSRWRRIRQHLWQALTVFSEKGAFSMSASLALSGVFVLLAGLGLMGILMQGLQAGPAYSELLFSTLFPKNFQGLVNRVGVLVTQVEARMELYTVLTVLFLYFAFNLMLSLTSNLNYLFGISSTHNILDLSFLFGIFWKGFLLRLSSVGVVMAIALGSFLWLQAPDRGLNWLRHPLVNDAFSVLVLGIMLLIVLPLDDVPMREKLITCFGIALFLPPFNSAFDYMAQNFQSYKLLMKGAMVALITLWIYFLCVIGLFLLCLQYSLRNLRHVKSHEPSRTAIYLEVLRLAPTEPTFDKLQQTIGATRARLHEVIDDLVGRGVLQRFSPGIKPTSYTGDYHYRIPGRLDPEKVRDALFPELESALGADVPVTFRTQVGEVRASLTRVVEETSRT